MKEQHEFSCEFFVKRKNDEFEYEDISFTSTIPYLSDNEIDLDVDVYWKLEDRNEFKNIEEGILYHVYVRGELNYYTSHDYNNVEPDENIFEFNFDFIKIIKLRE